MSHTADVRQLTFCTATTFKSLVVMADFLVLINILFRRECIRLRPGRGHILTMDPLSAGASVLAFIGILNSLQLIYETLSSIQDGPESVRLAANSVSQLRSILKRLQHQQSLTDSDGEAQLKQCADDVEVIANKLALLQISPYEKRSGKIWKHIRAALNEKDIDRMNRVIGGHFNCPESAVDRPAEISPR
jgi:hypothetical protein